MAISIVPRKEVRAKIAELIGAEAVTQGIVITTYAVAAYAPKTVASAKTTISVTSASSDHRLILEDTNDHAYEFDIWIYVPRTGDGSAEEDALDEWERLIGRVVEDNPVMSGYWTDLQQREATQATYVLIGGMQYRAEVFPLKVQPQRDVFVVGVSVVGGPDVIAD